MVANLRFHAPRHPGPDSQVQVAGVAIKRWCVVRDMLKAMFWSCTCVASLCAYLSHCMLKPLQLLWLCSFGATCFNIIWRLPCNVMCNFLPICARVSGPMCEHHCVLAWFGGHGFRKSVGIGGGWQNTFVYIIYIYI